MLKTIVLIWLTLIPLAAGICQVTLLDYKETGNEILLMIALDKADFSHYDESRPGELYLPKRNILIALPFKEVPEINYRVRKNIRFRYIPPVNPMVNPRDSLLEYDFNPAVIKPNNSKEAVIINGYLYVGKYYCISLDISQYDYDIDGFLNEINEVEIALKFSNNIARTPGSADNDKASISDIIINCDAAKNYLTSARENDFTDTTDKWIDYNKPYCRIKIARDGIYRITFEDLSVRGVNTSTLNPSSINIYNKGQKIPIYVSGETDKIFEPGDFIEFIGHQELGGKHREIAGYNSPYNEYLGRYTDTTVYWLTWDETSVSRAECPEIQTAEADTLEHYYEIIHYEQDNWFDYSTEELIRKEHPYWIENKTWGWHAIYPGTTIYNFTLDELVPDHIVNIYAKFQSYASDIKEKAHLVLMGLNESEGSDSSWLNKYEQKVIKASILSNRSQKDNKLKLFSFPTEAAVNTIFFDWYEIEYPRYLMLYNDSLRFRFSEDIGIKNIKIGNFRDVKYSLWKDGRRTARFNFRGNFQSELTFQDTISAGDIYFITGEEKIKTPFLERPKQFRNLRNIKQADYILITHNKFLSAAEEYKKFIESAYQVKVEITNVQDIYDEYSFGSFNPEAIRDFLKSTYQNWQEPLPKYVLLAGDGTYDYHRNKEKNLGNPRVENYVPSYGAPVSDNWFVIWDTAGVNYSAINIGRIPVKTIDEFYFYLNKHKTYKSRKADDWNKRYMFFSGGSGDNEDELNQLREINQKIIDNYVTTFPVGGNAVHFYKTLNPVSNFGPFSYTDIAHKIDSSALFISYLGHSGTQTWDNGVVDPSQLSGLVDRYPLITDFGCSTGKFAEPDVNSFAELFINKGNAIVYIGNSSLGFFSTSTVFPLKFYKKILADSVYRISEAHKLSRLELLGEYGTSSANSLFNLTNTFFGDPIIELPVPTEPDLSINRSDIIVNPALPGDDLDSIEIQMTIHNYGKVTPDSVTISVTDTFLETIITERSKKIAIPSYSVNIHFSVPVHNLPGNHSLKVNLDSQQEIVEYNEENNVVSFNVYISNSDLKILNDYSVESSVKDTILILNPVYSDSESDISLELSREENFSEIYNIYKTPGNFTTDFKLTDKIEPGRWWIRGGKQSGDSYSFNRSFYLGQDYDFLLNDSVSFRNTEVNNMKIEGNKVVPDSYSTLFKIISAGYNDGKTAIISKNGETYIPSGNLIGHHVCVFKDSTYEFVDYKRFNVFGGISETGDYYKYLDTISSGYLVLIAVSDEGRVPDSLKRILHEFGSIYIDSLRFRSSWALIGKRGAPRGSVPEDFSNPFEGKVQIDTTILNVFKSGYLVTPLIGPSARWEKLIVDIYGSDIKIFPVICKDEIPDTLENIYKDNSEIDISGINSEENPYLKLKIQFNTKTEVSSLGVNYLKRAELFTNVRQTYIEKDTIVSGEAVSMHIKIFNAGEKSSGNFKIVSEIIYSEYLKDTLFEAPVSSVSPGLTATIDTSILFTVPGSQTLNIIIDSGNEVDEIYEDNNLLGIPVFIDQSGSVPSAKIFFDGLEVFDGDYVDYFPEIKILVSDYPIMDNDTSFLKVYIDEDYVPFENIKYNNINQRMELKLRPSLEEGEHLLKILFRDSLGVYSGAGGGTIRVIVDRGERLMSVYNYPNPFNTETYFTFRITGIPDELQINIYTIAGRLIKKITRHSADLKTDFNSVYWDGRDEDGDPVSSGVYLYKLTAVYGGKSKTVIQKLAVVR